MDNGTLRAAVVERYGPPEVAEVRDVARPTPGPGEVLVRVRVTAVTTWDARIRAARFPTGMGPMARLGLGLTKPRRPILGGTFSGEVESVGAKVTTVAPGDRVCGMNGIRMGAHAQYVTVPAARLVTVPDAVSHEQAAGVLFGGTTALYFLRDRASVREGATVLVNGASGAIGTNAVQIAARQGAVVTGVCSAANAELVMKLGATRTIDHRDGGLDRLTDRFDIVLDTVGNLSVASGRALLADGGVLLLAAAGLPDMLRARGNVRVGTSKETAEAFATLVHQVADGTLEVIVEESFPLDRIADAYRRVDTGRKVGNVLVTP